MMYREPKCYELSGTEISQDGFHACFSRHTLRLNGRAEDMPYVCQKAADGLYAVQAGARLVVTDTHSGCTVCMPMSGEMSRIQVGLPGTISLKGHTLSFLAAPGVRFRHTFGDESALTVRDAWVLTRFCQNGTVYAVLLDTHLLRAVGAYTRGGQTHACALYATYVQDKEDDSLDYSVHLLYKKLYNPLSALPMRGGLRQFVAPASDELAGREFCARMRDGSLLTLRCAARQLVVNDETLPYTAVKCDDEAHMVLIGEGTHTMTVLLDEQTGGVVLIDAALDARRPLERQVQYTLLTGALEGRPGQPEITGELTGKRIIWTYNPNDEILHVFPRDDLFRLGHWEGVPSDTPDDGEKRVLAWLAGRKENYPCYEEPAEYVKVHDSLYLYCVLEQNVHARLPEQGGNLLIVALNTALMRYAGRCFGRDGQLRVEDMRIGAVGRFYTEQDATDAYPLPYYPPLPRL